eukprot:m.235647 g.235647  ORF g.235647 m.235647 type:complete len:481 (+) comp17407_c0_seq2:186-1628(+)
MPMADFTSPPLSSDEVNQYVKPTPVLNTGGPRLKSLSAKRSDPPPSPIPSKSPAKAKGRRRANIPLPETLVAPLDRVRQDYQTIRELQRNEFSAVEESQRPDGTLVIIKRIRGAQDDEPQEARIMRRIRDHHARQQQAGAAVVSNCLTYDHIWYQDSQHCLELRKYDMSLKHLIEYKTQPEQALWVVARELLKALAELHDLGVVHMDVKPANVLLDRTYGLALCDYGISVQLSLEKPTQDGDGLYLAPEVLTKDYPVTYAVDIFSLGVTLLECSTKYHIDSDDCRDSLRKGIIPGYALSDSSSAWQRMLQAMVSLNPSQRPTPAQLLDPVRVDPTLLLADDSLLIRELNERASVQVQDTPPRSALPQDGVSLHRFPSGHQHPPTVSASQRPSSEALNSLSRSLPGRLFDDGSDVPLMTAGRLQETSPPSTVSGTRLDFGGGAGNGLEMMMDDDADDLEEEFAPRNLSQLLDESLHDEDLE